MTATAISQPQAQPAEQKILLPVGWEVARRLLRGLAGATFFVWLGLVCVAIVSFAAVSVLAWAVGGFEYRGVVNSILDGWFFSLFMGILYMPLAPLCLWFASKITEIIAEAITKITLEVKAERGIR